MSKLQIALFVLAVAAFGVACARGMHQQSHDGQQQSKGPDLTDEPLYVTPLLHGMGAVKKPAGLDAWAGSAWTPKVMKVKP